MRQRDFAPQASIFDVAKNAGLIADAAVLAGVKLPTLETCRDRFEDALSLGHGAKDMAGVILAFEATAARVASVLGS